MATPVIGSARALAARALMAEGRNAEADIVLSGGGDDFPEVQVARLALDTIGDHHQRLELALAFYAEPDHWDSDVPDGSLASLDRGEVARSALRGKDQLGSHRD
ncbi:hypothetical protein M9978_22635 [Sphingomonas sp. MG17]|uniref:Uncharacterized protein n=1 Tax=Sphingomonas tagetis TaxID=2949092 RepID=A0A9X2HV26_9SPHN|nr:hypothetical protein [Sphingomonas tagetis]MCP3733205.1 hypothetical protein [Sphingomonas tagetis]